MFRLRTGVTRFHPGMHEWGLALSPDCECDATEKTAANIPSACPIYRVPHGARGPTVSDAETCCRHLNRAVGLQ